MLPVLITIDTEYSSGFYARGIATDWVSNFDRTIACRSPAGEAGIFYQMDVLERCNMKGVFFVDPMPALIWGQRAIDAVIKPIIDRGHDVQMHVHSEWLQFAANNPLSDKIGTHIKNFSVADQIAILEYAMAVIVKAGAPAPIAFRAGNYGANDDTLAALAALGLVYDSSFPPGIAASDCEISLPESQYHPIKYLEIIEIPIAAISAGGDGRRHGQITALSAQEMIAAIEFARAQNWSDLVLVSHSFEMYNRDKQRPNRIVMRRFETLCEWISMQDDVHTATFSQLHQSGGLAPIKLSAQQSQLLSHSPMRTAHRMVEQLIGNLRYG